MLRRRLDAGYTAGEFPVLDAFKSRGATDYVCIVERIANDMCFGVTRGVVASWCADGAGFDDASIRLLEALMPAFATAFLARTMRKTTRALLATYLGQDAADRVLAGNVIRGRAEKVRAVVWFADLLEHDLGIRFAPFGGGRRGFVGDEYDFCFSASANGFFDVFGTKLRRPFELGGRARDDRGLLLR